MEKEAKQGWSFTIHRIAVNNLDVAHKLREQNKFKKYYSLQLRKQINSVPNACGNDTFKHLFPEDRV